MRALWSDRPYCSHNVSQKVKRIRRLSEQRECPTNTAKNDTPKVTLGLARNFTLLGHGADVKNSGSEGSRHSSEQHPKGVNIAQPKFVRLGSSGNLSRFQKVIRTTLRFLTGVHVLRSRPITVSKSQAFPREIAVKSQC